MIFLNQLTIENLQLQGHKSQSSIDKIVHPKLPPMLRAQPALRELHFFTKEGDEEKKERKLARLGVDDEEIEAEQEEEEETVRLAPAPPQIASTTGFASFALPSIREVASSASVATTAPVVPVAAPIAAPSVATPFPSSHSRFYVRTCSNTSRRPHPIPTRTNYVYNHLKLFHLLYLQLDFGDNHFQNK